jgi:hypothetical protein
MMGTDDHKKLRSDEAPKEGENEVNNSSLEFPVLT